MTFRFEDLTAAIERNDSLTVARYLRGASEPERRAVNSKLLAIAKRNLDFQGNRAAAAVAVLGTAAGARQASEVLRSVFFANDKEQALQVLTDRKPAWLADLPRALLATSEFRNQWPFVRALIRAGLVAKPDSAEYTTRMPDGLSTPLFRPEVVHPSIEQQLIEDRDLLEDEVFRLFRVEGSATSLYWADKSLDRRREWGDGKWVDVPGRPEATWRATLARLARRGLINFDRLLDECIAVFQRDLRPSHFGWYVDMHKELAPTIDELAARAAQYQRLLAADTSLGVGVGQDALQVLLSAGRVDRESLVAASGPAISRAEKGIVLKQLKMLGSALKQHPDLASSIAEVLPPALSHENPAIQEAAHGLMARLPADRQSRTSKPVRANPPDGEVAEADEMLFSRAAHLGSESPWAAQIQANVEAVKASSIPNACEIRAGPGAALPSPISDPEELIEAFTRLVEDASDPVLIERALAGAVRTARLPIAERKRWAEPLAKRALEQLPGWPSGLTGGEVRAMVASVAYTWATGTRVKASFGERYNNFEISVSSLNERFLPVTPTGVFAIRAIEAIELIAGGTQVELLSEPTHDRGAVDPDAFVERAQKHYGKWFGTGPPKYDLEMAALRVPSVELNRRLNKLPRQLRDRVATLSRDPSNLSDARVVTGNPVDRWKSHNDPVVLARVTLPAAESTILKTLAIPDPLATYIRLAGEGEYASDYGPSIRTWALIAPWQPELIAAHLLRPLSRALQPGRHDHGPSATACLMNADTPLGAIGHLALAMASVGAEADTRTAAADVFAAAARDGRIQPVLMAGAWQELARAGVFQAKRVDATLRPLASHPAGGLRLAQALQLGIGPLIELGARDMHMLVRLAVSLGSSYGVFPGDPRLTTIAQRKSATELVTASRALIAARDQPPVISKAAAVELLDGLLLRAERESRLGTAG